MLDKLTYFIITRNIFDSAIWRNDPHILKLFIYLIGTGRNARKPKNYPGFKVNRGELVTSLNQIAENNEYMRNGILKKWSKQKVSRMLNTLVEQGEIKLLSDTYGTHISVCNYDYYQDPATYKPDGSGTPVEQPRNDSGTVVVLNNNDNNGNNENNELTALQKWIKDNLKQVSKMKQQLSLKESEKLLQDFTKKEIWDILENMDNYEPLLKNISVNKTARNWLARRKEKSEPETGEIQNTASDEEMEKLAELCK